MTKSLDLIGKIIRTTAASVLGAGSASIVFAAIVLVKAAQAHGTPVAEAAAANAPVFIGYSKVLVVAAFALLIGESLDYAERKDWSKLTILQYACSLLAVCATMIFAFGLVPEMDRLLPLIKDNADAYATFHKLHEYSRPLFGTIILLSFFSLILPLRHSTVKASNSSKS